MFNEQNPEAEAYRYLDPVLPAEHNNPPVESLTLRLAHQLLTEREERHSLLTLVIQELIYEWVPGGDRVELIGGSVAAMLDHSPEARSTGTWWWSHLHPNERDHVLADFETWLRSSESTWTHEYRFRRKDDSYALLLDRAHALRDESGQVVRVVGSLSDVTAQRQAEARNRVLESASRRFAEARLDWATVLNEVVTVTAAELGDLCLMSFLSPDREWIDPVAVSHRNPERRRQLKELLSVQPCQIGEGLLGTCALTSQPVRLAPITPVTREQVKRLLSPDFEPYAVQFGLRSILIVPLVAHGVMIGTLLVARDGDGEPFTADDEQFLEQLADRAAATIDCAQLYRDALETQDELDRALGQERRIADQLQRCFRSGLPDQLPGYSLGHAYQCALDEARIGGDFYDLFPLSRGRYGILMGDVSGKGLAAAVVTVKARYYLRGLAATYADPGEVIRLLNDVLYEDLEGEAFVTLFYGVLSLSDHRLTYVTAGHELPLLQVPGENMRPLETTGPLLGVVPGLSYETQEMEFCPGASLLLYTDGITDARRDGKFLGMQRLAGWFEARGKSFSGQALVDRLVGDLEEFTRGYLPDDIACMLLQRNPV